MSSDGPVLDCLGFPIPQEAERRAVAEAHARDREREDHRTAALARFEQAFQPKRKSSMTREDSQLVRQCSIDLAQHGYTPVLEEIMKEGVKAEARPRIWATALRTRSKKASSNADYRSYIDEGTSLAHQSAQEQVDNDLRRTFPPHACFRDGAAPGWTCLLPHLRRVLCALAARCVEGYCQGLSYIAGFLLLVHLSASTCAGEALHPHGCSEWQWAGTAPEWARNISPSVEEEVFWVLVCLLENVLPGFYNTSLDGVRTEVALVETVVSGTIPALHDHLQANGLPVSMAVFEWLMGTFTTKVPSLTLLRIWDLLVIGGRDALLHTAVVLLADTQQELLACETPDACMRTIKDKVCHRHDHAELIPAVVTRWRPGDRQQTSLLEASRLYCAQQVQAETFKTRRRQELQKTFKEFDSNNTGSLSRAEFARLLQKVFDQTDPRARSSNNGSSFSSSGSGHGWFPSLFRSSSARKGNLDDCQLLASLFDAIDIDMDGFVSWQEFAQASRAYPWLLGNLWHIPDCGRAEDRLRLLFHDFDADSNGALDKKEFSTFVETVYTAVASQSSRLPSDTAQRAWQAEAGLIFDAADLDGNGVITYDEFEEAAFTTPVLLLGTRLLSTSDEKRALGALAEIGSFSAVITGVNIYDNPHRAGPAAYIPCICHEDCNTARGRHARYDVRVEVEHPSRPYSVRRRYSEFLKLHQRVADLLRARSRQEGGSLLHGAWLPAFPPKTGLHGGKCSEAITVYRQQALQTYLDAVRRMPDAEVQAILREWLGLPYRRINMPQPNGME